MITTTDSLASHIHVAPRFSRSVHLEKDFKYAGALGGYVLTSTARAALQRISACVKPESSQRAWSLTGPYGSGKSAFALFLAHLLDHQEERGNQEARNILRSQDESLYRSLFDKRHKGALSGNGFCPVLISGTREPLAVALIRALEYSVREYWFSDDLPPFHQKLVALLNRSAEGHVVSGREVAQLYSEAASDSGAGAGILVIVDELGKFLEHVAAAPKSGDMGVLQDLAEAANRSADTPLVLVTLLHQAFERYAGRLTPLERDEWAKVQGRFEDIVFHETPEQILRVVASALSPTSDSDTTRAILTRARAEASLAVKAGLRASSLSLADFTTLCAQCYPLHPTVAVQLGSVFRRLAQNERSLFAFLGAQEPFGLRDFMSTHDWVPDLPSYYRLDNLYDYLVSSLGGALFSGLAGKRWSDVESCLERHSRGTDLELRLIKCIGLMQAMSAKGSLKASREFLRFAFVDGVTTETEVDAALQSLLTNSIVVYRSHAGAYGLWEGSDIDLESRLQDAFAHIDASEPLVRLLASHSAPRPFVARRHSFETGTLRHFEVRYVDDSTINLNYMTPSVDADGLVLCALPNSEAEADTIERRAQQASLASRDGVLIAVPLKHALLREGARELAALRWIASNTPELASDLTARRELNARVTEVSQWLDSQLQSLFGNDDDGLASCRWFYKGQVLDVTDAPCLNRTLSGICDEVFRHSPRVLNELINRKHLSSAAAAARRNLMEAMLSNAAKPALAIEGFPPELSIYRSVLERSGIHREEGGTLAIRRPLVDADTRLAPLWEELDRFFESTTGRSRTAEELFASLQRPPYGVKMGLLPVLLLAYLLHHHEEIAVYESNSFVPRLTMAILERLVKSPKDFAFHKASLTGAREAVYDGMLRALQASLGVVSCERNLLSLVRPLCRLVEQMPGYARKTRRLSEGSLQLREAILSAREPDRLIFTAIPEAYGLPAVVPDGTFTAEMTAHLEESLRRSVEEFQGAYGKLLDQLEVSIKSALQLNNADRASIAKEASNLRDKCVDTKLMGLLMRLEDEESNRREWLESLGDHLAGRTPETWTDEEHSRFEVGLIEVARQYRHLRALMFETLPIPEHTEQAYRIGLTRIGKVEREQVVTVSKAQAANVKRTVSEMRKAVTKGGKTERWLMLAALAQLAAELLDEEQI